MKRQIPLLLAFLAGLWGFILQLVPALATPLNVTNNIIAVITSFSLALGIASLFRYHATKIRRKSKDMFFSYLTFVAMFFMIIVGIVGYYVGGAWQETFNNMYNYVRIPLDATMFSLLAFYITSAAYRAFRARTWLATLLLTAGFLVMIGRVMNGPWNIFGSITQWLMQYPTTAAMRAINIGVGLGMVATSVKIVLGIEQSYLGGGE